MTVHRKPEQTGPIGRYPAWKLEDAKARFSEVVRKAREQGPQRVTYRGSDAVVVIAASELEKLLPSPKPETTLLEVLQSSELYKLKIRRSRQGARKLRL